MPYGYDNDKIVKGTYKSELYCWLIFAVINPLIISLAVFPHHKTMWIALLAIQLFYLPLYILYSRFIVARFLFKRKYVLFGALTLGFSLLVILLQYLIYKIPASFARDAEQEFFSFSGLSFAREYLWILINISLAVAISYLRFKLGEEETVEILQKENTYYKLRYFRTQLNPHFLFNTLTAFIH